MSLDKEIKSIISIHLWKFDGLPDEIISALDKLLTIHERDDIIATMNTMVPLLEAEEARARKFAGNSGFAGEQHMAIGMQLKYLNESIALLRENR